VRNSLICLILLWVIIILAAGCKTSTDPNRVANPVFSPEPGNYENSQLVSINCATAGAEIRYTTDGSVPPTNSMIYNQPFLVDTGTIVKAIATKPGMENSEVITALYGTVVHAPLIAPAGGNYQLAPTVMLSCATPGAGIRYTTDGSEPTENSALYCVPFILSHSATLKAKAFKENCVPSLTSVEVYTVQLQIRSHCDTPGSARGVVIRGNYAYVADWDVGLQIIDLSDLDSPHIEGSCATPGQGFRVAVAGNYAYLTDRYAGLQVINISDPANPFITGALPISGECRGVVVAGNYVYTNNPFTVVDVSDPSNPVAVGSCSSTGLLDGMTISGNYAYAASWSGGLEIFNIGNPFAPSRIGSANTPYYAWDVAVSGTTAYVAASEGGLFAFDVSDPNNPVQIANLPMQSTTQGVSCSGNHALVADGGWGMKVIRISEPSTPVQVGWCDTPGWAYGVAVSGNLICIADGDAGIQLFSLE